MTTNINDIMTGLWDAFDKLRAETHLRASEYAVPVLGLIFLKYAEQKFVAVDQLLQAKKLSENQQILIPVSYKAEGAIYLDEKARFNYLCSLNKGIDGALNQAMYLIERDNAETFSGVLPTNSYKVFDDNTLKALLTTLDCITSNLETDLFGKIYEYFLYKFALAEGQRDDEFFTPTSIVRLIVEIVEPYNGRIFDPSCGSGTMFVQSVQFARSHQHDPAEEISLYGQESNLRAIQMCTMNLFVHNITGNIQKANSYYEDLHANTGKFDFVVANPPFNVNNVDKTHLLLRHYPFGMPQADNANYLWIQLFYNALKETGRAGFVMPTSASDARLSDQEIRRRLIQQRVVDVIVSVNSNFFYAVTLPCTLWFFDKGRWDSARSDKVLFINAHDLYEQIDRAHREFTSMQIEFLANIVRLYRGEPIENFQGSGSRLQEVFPNNKYIDSPGLCKMATLAEIEAQGWSLNPGHYVGVKKSSLESTIIPSINRKKVFVAYCHRDKGYLERLRVHLAFLEREDGIVIWDDTIISPGEIWHEEIKKSLASAKVAILLVSADFLASKFIAEDELPPLLQAAKEEEATILSVILSPCMFTKTKLTDYQSINDPLQPLTGMNKHNKERIWDKVARRVRDVMASNC
jgi:type I restriction enzyme M protein